LIKKVFPKTPYEKESFLKGFILFLITVEVLLVFIFLLLYRNEAISFRQSLFLEMKNYSYTFEGEKFHLDVVSLKDYPNKNFYEPYEDKEGYFILVPVPVSANDALKIFYPRNKFLKDLNNIKLRVLFLFFISSLIAIFISITFSLYALNPLREALRMIEEITKDIIHDINTPLMSLMVNIKILKSKYKDEEIERIQLALKQLQQLRENLRPLKAKTQLTLTEVNLKKVIDEELEDLVKIYPDIRVERKIESVTIRTDETAFRRIISNLLNNAFRHNITKGWIKIKLSRDQLKIENSSSPVKNPRRIFQRYYRESQRGLGLGLSIVKKLCEELGWKIKADYKEGVFSISIYFNGIQAGNSRTS